ncbi:MAG: hypothetical protein BEN18_00390 [Epulopiscium sp. Nuni2H_MBin001]|nr:MAG: hypothetical protein BEN18_00390 [Epulopiscium sp. Nuni2H_MBin001]
MTGKDTDLTKQMNLYKNKKIVLWGANDFCIEIITLFRQFNIDILACCDNNKVKWGTNVEGILIISPKELEELYIGNNDILVIIANESLSSINEVSKQLDNMGITGYIIAQNTWLNLQLIPLNILHELNTSTLTWYVSKQKLWAKREQCKWNLDMLEAIDNNPTNLVLLCLPPKTGDHTLNRTLSASKVNYVNICHSSKRFEIDLLTDPIIKVITAVRDPLSQHLSNTYERLNLHMCINKNNKWLGQFIAYINNSDKTPEEAIKQLKDTFYTTEFNSQAFFDLTVANNTLANNSLYKPNITTFLENFAEDILNITAYPFDKEKGYTIIKEGRLEIFVYQLEKLNDIIPELSEFATSRGEGQPFTELVNGNIGEEKSYAESYKRAKKEIIITQEYFDACFDAPYVHHFYSEADIEKFKARWRPHIKEDYKNPWL